MSPEHAQDVADAVMAVSTLVFAGCVVLVVFTVFVATWCAVYEAFLSIGEVFRGIFKR